MLSSKLKIVGVCVAFIVAYVLFNLVFALMFDSAFVIVGCADVAIIICVYAYCSRYIRKKIPQVVKAYDVFTYAALLACIWLVSQVSAACIVEFGDDAFSSYSNSISSMSPLAMFFLSCILAPWAEEMLFRGAVYATMRKQFGIVCSAIVSAVSFSLLHMTLTHIPMTLMMGLFLCLIYERYQRIWVCVVIHAGYNLATLLLTFVELPMILVNPVCAGFMVAAILFVLIVMLRHLPRDVRAE